MINVKRNVKNIIERSFIIKELIESGAIGVVGAMYNIETGVVEWYDDVMYIQDEVLQDVSSESLRY